MDAGGLPDGLVLTLPKVTYPEQVTAMVRLLRGVRDGPAGCTPGRIGFEIQIETTQSILAADGAATVARMIDAAEGRATGLHYGTFDYSAACGVSAAYQSMDHPAADHAKAVMQVAAAGTGVRALRRLHQRPARSAPPSRSTTPGGSTTAQVRRSLARAYYQGWDMHPGHLPDPLRRRLRLLPRGPGRGGGPARRHTPADDRRRRAWTNPPPPRRSAAICCAAWTAAPWTGPRPSG